MRHELAASPTIGCSVNYLQLLPPQLLLQLPRLGILRRDLGALDNSQGAAETSH